MSYLRNTCRYRCVAFFAVMLSVAAVEASAHDVTDASTARGGRDRDYHCAAASTTSGGERSCIIGGGTAVGRGGLHDRPHALRRFRRGMWSSLSTEA